MTGSLKITGSQELIGPLTVGANEAGHDVKFFGNTADRFMLYDASANQLQIEGNIKLNGPSGNAILKTDIDHLSALGYTAIEKM